MKYMKIIRKQISLYENSNTSNFENLLNIKIGILIIYYLQMLHSPPSTEIKFKKIK